MRCVIVSNIFLQSLDYFLKLVTLNLYANIFKLFFSHKAAALRFMSAFVCKAFSILTPCLFPRPYLSEQQERHKYGMGKLFQATLSRGHISFHTNKLSIIVTMEVRTYKFVTSV